ncbi:hypothetical protein ACOSQ2_013538 [Xanthoceras sorbifolium]
MSSRRSNSRKKSVYDDEEPSPKSLFHHGASTIFRVQGDPPGVPGEHQAVFCYGNDGGLSQVGGDESASRDTTVTSHQGAFHYRQETKKSSSGGKGR